MTNPAQIYIAKETHEELHAALDAISNREREYLLYRFGFEDNIEHPLTETAEHFFLSESRAKSTERLALDNVWLDCSLAVSLTRGTDAAAGFYIPLAPPLSQKISPLQLQDFLCQLHTNRRILLIAKFLAFCVPFSPQNPPVLASAEKCLSGVGQPLSSVSGRQRYNTLDFASENRVPIGMLLTPIGNPEPRDFTPLDTPIIFSTNGTHIEKTAFYHVGPFLENATAHDIHFCRGFAKISTCAVGRRAQNSVFANTENFLVTLLRQKNNSGLFVDSTWSAISKIFFKKFQ